MSGVEMADPYCSRRHRYPSPSKSCGAVLDAIQCPPRSRRYQRKLPSSPSSNLMGVSSVATCCVRVPPLIL